MKNYSRLAGEVQIMVVTDRTKAKVSVIIESNFELLLTQIFCIRLNSGRGIVRVRVGLPYDPLRFCPRSFDLFSSFVFKLLPGLFSNICLGQNN